MIKKFKNFDSDKFIEKKKALKEAVDADYNDDAPVKKVTEDDVITTKAVYENPIILKISNIVSKKLKDAGIGEFGIYHDIIYLNGVPGVWFYGVDDNHKSIVCCRDTNTKIISVFNDFQLGETNKAIVTYSTKKFGFKDMLAQLVDDLNTPAPEVSESVLLEAGGFGGGYSKGNILNFKKFPWADKQFVYDIASKNTKGDAKLIFKNGIGKDKNITRILAAFSPRHEANEGSAKYIVELACDIFSDRYSAMDADFKSLADEYKMKYKGGSPAITVDYDTDLDTSDFEAEEADKLKALEDARKAEIAEDTRQYNRTLRKLKIMATAMCHYVKQNGKLDADDASAMVKRGLFITGIGGIGKSHSIQEVLEENNMVSGRDYVNISSGSTTAESIFNYLYQYNDKLLIFDDSPDLFSEPKKIAVWKSALQSDGTKSEVTYPLQNTKDTGTKLYKTGVLTRQERYFKEMGRKSTSEKLAYQEKRLNELRKELGVEFDRTNALTLIADEWKELQSETVPLMPDKYIYNGVVIVIGNDTREVLRREVGPGHWSAIIDRFKDFDISPMAESVWNVIKDKIMYEYGHTEIPDSLCIIPRDMVEEFVAEVDKLIVDPDHNTMTWRVICEYSKALRGKYGLEDWKEDLADSMRTNK